MNNNKINYYDNDYYELVNKKRINDKKIWLQILENEAQENNKVLDILHYLYDCKNYTSNGKNIAQALNTKVGAINLYISNFGKRIINMLHLEEQIGTNSQNRRWNIPFETVPELNTDNTFTWKLRNELIETLVEKYNLTPKDELKVREAFINKFTIDKILQLSIDDFVIGRAEIDTKGKESFCYLIERDMIKLGDMRGAYVNKFGVWFSKKNNRYEYSKKFGNNLEIAFKNLKKEIYLLLISAENDDYEKINTNKIATIFKEKILSTYFPNKYLCIFKEEDVDKFLNILNIKYDMHKINTFEKKKMLLKEYRNTNKYFKDKDDYYFVTFLYTTFKEELKIKNTVSGEIDCNLEFTDFIYLEKH